MAAPVQPHPGEGAVDGIQVALPSYVSILGVRSKTTIKRARTEHRLEEKDGYPAVFFAPRDVDRAKVFMNNALILKFAIGQKPPLGDVRSTINKDWGLLGDYTLGIIDHRHILMKVQAEEEVVKVLSREKNHIRGTYFQVSRWAIDFDPRRDTPMASMWIDLPGLKLHHYHPDVLTTIAEAIGGKFLKADDETLCQTRATHARICVEVDLLKQMPDFCFIADPSREGYWQRIRFPVKTPLFCCFCYRKGHEVNQCRVKGEMLAKRGGESMKNMNVAPDNCPSKLAKQQFVVKSTNQAQPLVNSNDKQFGAAANMGVSNTKEQKDYTVDSQDFCRKAGEAAKEGGTVDRHDSGNKAGVAAKEVVSEVNADLRGEKVHVANKNGNLVSKSGQLDISGEGKKLNSVSSNTRRKKEDVQWRKEIQNGTRKFPTVNNVSNIATSINRFNLLLDEDECGSSLKLQSEENTQGENSEYSSLKDKVEVDKFISEVKMELLLLNKTQKDLILEELLKDKDVKEDMHRDHEASKNTFAHDQGSSSGRECSDGGKDKSLSDNLDRSEGKDHIHKVGEIQGDQHPQELGHEKKLHGGEEQILNGDNQKLNSLNLNENHLQSEHQNFKKSQKSNMVLNFGALFRKIDRIEKEYIPNSLDDDVNTEHGLNLFVDFRGGGKSQNGHEGGVSESNLDEEEDEKEAISDFEEEPSAIAPKAKQKKNILPLRVKTRSQVTSTSPRYKS